MAGEHTLAENKIYRSHHDARLHPLTDVTTKCQPSTSYGIQEIAQTRL